MRRNFQKGTRDQRRLRRTLVGGVTMSVGLAMAAGSALAEGEDGTLSGDFSGSARNYGVYAAAALLNNQVNLRANIAEGVAVADSSGLDGYQGTGVGELAVPGAISNNPDSRSYARASPIGAGALGLSLQLVKAESSASTVVDGVRDDQDFGDLTIPALGSLRALTGVANSAWNSNVLTTGGQLAYAESNTGALTLIDPTLGIPLPGSIFPVGEADLGQNSSEVRLVGDTAVCPTGLALESAATWKWADIKLFDGLIGVSWGGDSGSPEDTPTIVARANGKPAGASLTVPEMPAMTVRIGDAALDIEPGLSIELDQVFNQSPLGEVLGRLVDGELNYGGITNRVEAADGTRASGTMNGLTADLTIAPIPGIAPDGLGSAELGFERVDVDANVASGGINCDSGGSQDGQSQSGQSQSGQDQSGQSQSGQDQSGQSQSGQDQSGQSQSGQDQSGQSQAGQSQSGQSQSGQDQSGQSQSGQDQSGQSQAGQSQSGQDQSGQDQAGQSQSGQDQSGQDQAGQSQSGQDQSGQSQSGQDQSGQSQSGQDQSGQSQSGQSQSGQSQSGQSQSGQSQSGQSQSGQSQSGQSQSGQSQSGQDQAGQNQSGQSQSGKDQAGQSQSGGSATGTSQSGKDQLGASGASGASAGGGLSGSATGLSGSASGGGKGSYGALLPNTGGPISGAMLLGGIALSVLGAALLLAGRRRQGQTV